MSRACTRLVCNQQETPAKKVDSLYFAPLLRIISELEIMLCFICAFVACTIKMMVQFKFKFNLYQLAGRGTEVRTPTRMVIFWSGNFYLENYDVL
jgi:hypothetical protein